jgi:dTDP-4-dehydrorhamnose reductase
MKAPVYMIFGSGGLLGRAFAYKLSTTPLSQHHRIFSFDHKMGDVTNSTIVDSIMEYVRPSIVIDCAAINDEEICEQAKTGAFSVNSRGAQNLAESCHKYGAKMVYFSSATVFDGTKMTPYNERNIIRPINVHGQSKASGENAIKVTTDDHLIIRVGWLFHHDAENCVTTWLEMADEGKEIPVIDDCHGSPTFVPDLVEATMELLLADAKGTFHVANADAATRQGFLEATLELANLHAKIVPVSSETQKGWKTLGPPYSVLSTQKYSLTTKKALRPWHNALKQCLFNMNRFKPDD